MALGTTDLRMNLLDTIYNRFMVPGFLVNSLPKAGTNLLGKAVALLSEICSGRIHIGQSPLARFRPPKDLPGVTVPRADSRSGAN